MEFIIFFINYVFAFLKSKKFREFFIFDWTSLKDIDLLYLVTLKLAFTSEYKLFGKKQVHIYNLALWNMDLFYSFSTEWEWYADLFFFLICHL